MLNDRDFDRAHQFIDSLHIEYPRDPQFYFGEGWVYDMQGDSIKARIHILSLLPFMTHL